MGGVVFLVAISLVTFLFNISKEQTILPLVLSFACRTTRDSGRSNKDIRGTYTVPLTLC